MATCAALAGGASLRFPGGKLGWKGPEGKPLLLKVLRALEDSGVCKSVIAVASPLTLSEVSTILDGTYEIARDPPWLPCSGPLRGIAAAALASGPELLVSAGDMAWLKPQPVAMMVDWARRQGATAAAPMWATGYVQTLAGYIREPHLVVEACIVRGPQGRPSDVYRAARKPLIIGSRLIGDPDGRTFISANTPRELANPESDPPGDALVDASQASRLYRHASRYEQCSPSRSLPLYHKEARIYESLGIRHFARHAWQDYCRTLQSLGHREAWGENECTKHQV